MFKRQGAEFNFIWIVNKQNDQCSDDHQNKNYFLFFDLSNAE